MFSYVASFDSHVTRSSSIFLAAAMMIAECYSLYGLNSNKWSSRYKSSSSGSRAIRFRFQMDGSQRRSRLYQQEGPRRRFASYSRRPRRLPHTNLAWFAGRAAERPGRSWSSLEVFQTAAARSVALAIASPVRHGATQNHRRAGSRVVNLNGRLTTPRSCYFTYLVITDKGFAITLSHVTRDT